MKTIHWQMPFASLNGTQYRIDIYAEGACESPVQLIGGATPFVTDEDNSDDFFAPTRTQTGNIEVLNTSGIVTMEEIMPSDTLDRPVVVTNVMSGKVEWIGFLSCEAYSQDYVSRPTTLSLAVKSVLEAMSDVCVDYDILDSTYMPIHKMVYYIVDAINRKAGVQTLSRVMYPSFGKNILTKKMDASTMFQQEDLETVDHMTSNVIGNSYLSFLSALARYMGWVVRERGGVLYFELVGRECDYILDYIETWNQEPFAHLPAEEVQTVVPASSLRYMGTGHTIDIRKGAKYVRVTSNVAEYDNEIELPENPVDYADEHYTALRPSPDANPYVYSLINTEPGFYDNMTFGYYKRKMDIAQSGASITAGPLSESNLEDVQMHSLIVAGDDAPAYKLMPFGEQEIHAGAYLADVSVDKERSREHDLSSGLYLCLFPATYHLHAEFAGAIAQVTSTLHCSIPGGTYLVVSSDIIPFSNLLDNAAGSGVQSLVFSLTVGGKSWDGSRWLDDGVYQFPIEIAFDKLKSNWDESMGVEQKDGYYIPVTEDLFGLVSLSIYPHTRKVEESSYPYAQSMFECLMADLHVENVFPFEYARNSRSSNAYMMVLPGNFSKEVTVDNDIIASYFNNRLSPTTLRDENDKDMKMLDYETDRVPYKIPEQVLLSYLGAYHGKPRACISLEVESPAEPLPMVRIAGYDSKTYLPLSESRDWGTGISTIACFETPDE